MEYVRAPSGIKLGFRRNESFERSMVLDEKADGEGNNLTDNMSNDRLNGRLNSVLSKDRKALLIELLASKPDSTAASIAEELGSSERTTRRDLKQLQEEGRISRDGSRKSGRWIVQGD